MTQSYNLFEGCRKNDARAQRLLFDFYKAPLMGLARRYTRDRDDAHDILQDAFIKIFTNFNQLTGSEKLEGWMKTIVIHTAINFYHKSKNKAQLFTAVDTIRDNDDGPIASIDAVNDEFLVSLINALPDGCRIIFNLIAIEGYSHAEVAKMLEVTEGTSRSQYHYAKQLIKEKLKCQNIAAYYEKFA